MKIRHLLTAAILLPTAGMAVTQAQQPTPQERPSITRNPTADPTDKVYPIEQIVTATVHDAWVLSGRNEEAFFDIVEQLAQFSAGKRGVTLPNSEAAGRRLGEMIKTRAKADHDALLYAIVDQAVHTLGTHTAAK